MRGIARRIRRLTPTVVLFWVAWNGAAAACPICISGLTVTPGQQIDSAEDVVMAAASSVGGTLVIVEVIKGDREIGEPIKKDAVAAARLVSMTPDGVGGGVAGAVDADDTVLLVSSDIANDGWRSLGPISPRFADWLRELARSGSGSGKGAIVRSWPLGALGWSDLAPEAWPGRLAIIAPHLESDDPLAAAIAYGELSRAPYTAQATLRSVVDPRAVRRWVNDPRSAERRSGYLLLLGFTGGAEDAEMLKRDIATARATHDVQDLAAMLAAWLEVEGPSVVDDIVEDYLIDPERSLSEIEAALLALSVHGGNGEETIPRRKIVDAYHAFVEARPRMAGFVATDLTDWREWDLTGEYVEILSRGLVQDPAERFAMTVYVSQSPDDRAKARLAALSESEGRPQ